MDQTPNRFRTRRASHHWYGHGKTICGGGDGLKLHPYQRRMADIILGRESCALWAEMGLGKTLATLTAINELLYDYMEPIKVLVIAPKYVAEVTWPEEINKWYPHLRAVVVAGDAKNRRKQLAKEADIYIMCRNNIKWLFEEYIHQNKSGWKWKTPWPFNTVVIDESGSFKDPKGSWFKTMARIRRASPQIVELTGTPRPGSLEDLWGQLYLIDGGKRLYESIGRFRARWMVEAGHIYTGGRQIPLLKDAPGAYEEVMELCKDVCISLQTKDWLELPERIDVVHKVKIPMTEYLDLKRDALIEIDGGVITAGSAGILVNKLLQVANGRVYDEERGVRIIHKAKQEALKDLITGPTLIFYNYKHDQTAIKEVLPHAKELDTKSMDQWNKGKVDILLAHPASAGHGLNLQSGGCTIIWYGVPYNLEWYLQANARLHRQGQKHTVVVHHLIAQDTIDEAVMAALERKELSQQQILDMVRYTG